MGDTVFEFQRAQFHIREELYKKEVEMYKNKLKQHELFHTHSNFEYFVKCFEVERNKSESKITNLQVSCLEIKYDLMWIQSSMSSGTVPKSIPVIVPPPVVIAPVPSPIKKVRKMRKQWKDVSPHKSPVKTPIKAPVTIPSPSPRPTQDYETKKSKKGLFSFKSMLSMTKLQPPGLKKK
jgi:hypothetical protein